MSMTHGYTLAALPSAQSPADGGACPPDASVAVGDQVTAEQVVASTGAGNVVNVNVAAVGPPRTCRG